MLKSIRNAALASFLLATGANAEELISPQLSDYEAALVNAHRMALANQELYQANCPTLIEEPPRLSILASLASEYQKYRDDMDVFRGDQQRYYIGNNASYNMPSILASPVLGNISESKELNISAMQQLSARSILIGQLHYNYYQSDQGVSAIYYPVNEAQGGVTGVLLGEERLFSNGGAFFEEVLNSTVPLGSALVGYGRYDFDKDNYTHVEVVPFDPNALGLLIEHDDELRVVNMDDLGMCGPS